MKFLTNQTVNSNKKMSVVWYDSHDCYWTFGYTKKMGSDMILNEWEHLLRTFPESALLFYPHPDHNYVNIVKPQNIIIINMRFTIPR